MEIKHPDVNSSQPIVAGNLLSKLTTFLKTISGKLLDLFDKLGESGMKIIGQKDLEGGGQWLKLEYNGRRAELTISPSDKDGVYNISIRSALNGTVTLDNIKEADIDIEVEAALHNIFYGSSKADDTVKSTNSLKVTLNTITSKTDVSINLTAINANYDIATAMQDLESVLDSEEFVSQLTEEPVSFEITDSGDSYDVQQIDCVDTFGTVIQLIQAAMQLWANIRVIHWAAKGAQFFDLHDKCDELARRALSDVDIFGEYAVEVNQIAPNPASQFCNSALLADQGGFTAEQGYTYMRDEIKRYVNILEALYVNFPHDMQSVIDEMIRVWTKDANYFFTRITM